MTERCVIFGNGTDFIAWVYVTLKINTRVKTHHFTGMKTFEHTAIFDRNLIVPEYLYVAVKKIIFTAGDAIT